MSKSKNKYDLTETEFMVLKLLVMGKSNAEIAKELYVSRYTVKAHVSHILQKMPVANRVEATAKAIRENIV